MNPPAFLHPTGMETISTPEEGRCRNLRTRPWPKALALDPVPCLKFSLCNHSVKCPFYNLRSCILIFPYDSGTLVPPPLEELVICIVCFYSTYFYSVEYSKWF